MINKEKVHEKWMKYALSEAIKAYDNDEVPVGAIIIKDNTIINDGSMLHGKVNKISLVSDLCCKLQADNSLFNSVKFIDACCIEDK